MRTSQIVIAFFCVSFALTAKKDEGTPLNNAKTEATQNPDFKCNADVMKMIGYRDAKVDAPSTAADDKMKAICPDLAQTCCTLTDLEGMKASFMDTRGKVEAGIKKLDEAVEEVNKQMSDLKKKAKEIKTDALKVCVGEADYAKHDDHINRLFDSFTTLQNFAKEVANDAFKHFASFPCEVCSSGFHIWRAEEGKQSKLMINAATFNSVYDNVRKIYKLKDLFESAIYAIKVAKCLGAVHIDDAHITESIKQFNDMIADLDKCVAKEEADFEGTKTCKTIISMYGVFDAGHAAEMVLALMHSATGSTQALASVEESAKAVENAQKSTDDGQTTSVTVTSTDASVPTYKFYKFGDNFNNLANKENAVMVEKGGVNMSANKMNKETYDVYQNVGGSSSKLWLWILGGVVIVAILGAVAYKYMRG